MRIVIADRFPITRAALAGLIRAVAPGADIVEFGTAAEAMEAVLADPADVLLCGWSTGARWRSNWLDEFVKAVQPGKLIALSPEIDRAACEKAMNAGAWGHLPLISSPEVMSAAIGLILAGGTYFPAMQPGVLGAEPLRGPPSAGARTLSHRQLQVLREIEKGRSNKEIADELGISVATVKLHVQAILKALGARNRTAAARWARESL